MFEFLEGRVDSVRPGIVVLRSGGAGWKLLVSSRSAARVTAGRGARLLVHMNVSDSALTLYGFVDEGERSLFRRLLQVSGVGPAAALGLLSALEPAALVQAITAEDTGQLTTVKGIGRKTAERLVLELRDSLKLAGLAPPEGLAAASGGELVRVLEELGFRPAQARTAVGSAREALGAEAGFEDLLRHALKQGRN
ncbi:MAG: Holliday junction branch migration protein RuvA [Planctomycetota bacterium]